MESMFSKHIDRRGTGSCKWDRAPQSVINAGYTPFSIADMEFEAPAPVISAIDNAVKAGVFGYTYADSAYKNAVLGFMKRRHNYTPNPESLLCTGGVVPALGLAIRAFTDKGDKVLIQPPVYPPFSQAIKDNGRQLTENPLIMKDNRYVMDFDGLERVIKTEHPKLMILCSPHNPVGRVWTVEELSTVGEICRANNVIIISDEIHSDIVYGNIGHTVLATLPHMADICCVCTAMSKTFNLAGLMCSNVFVENPVLREKLQRQIASDASDCIPFFARTASIAAYSECDFWIDELLSYLSETIDMCCRFIDERLPDIKYVRPEGTYLMWLDCRNLSMPCEELHNTLINGAGFFANPGEIFGTGGDGFIRVNIAAPRDVVLSAFERLYKALCR